MSKKIKLLKNNDKKDWTDLLWIEEFYEFLQGTNPESISAKKLSLSNKDAFRIIWYLQEHLSVFPDQIEKCSECDGLYDSHSEGHHSEKLNKFFCSQHDHLDDVQCKKCEEYFYEDDISNELCNDCS